MPDLLFVVLTAVDAGGDTDLPLEGGGKIVGIFKTQGLCHGIDTLSLAEQMPGSVHFHF